MGRVVEDGSKASNIGAGTRAGAETGIAEAGTHGGMDGVGSTEARGIKPEGAKVV